MHWTQRSENKSKVRLAHKKAVETRKEIKKRRQPTLPFPTQSRGRCIASYIPRLAAQAPAARPFETIVDWRAAHANIIPSVVNEMFQAAPRSLKDWRVYVAHMLLHEYEQGE